MENTLRKLEKEGNLEAGVVILQKELKEMLLGFENGPSVRSRNACSKTGTVFFFFNLFQIFGKQKCLERENSKSKHSFCPYF